MKNAPLHCPHFERGECRSCALLALPDNGRDPRKAELFSRALDASGVSVETLHPLWRPRTVFPSRTKAKLSVSGTMKEPLIGLVDRELNSTELLDCPLHLPRMNEVLHSIKRLIIELKIPPYHIERKQGELKGLILKANEDASETLVRFVLRSPEALAKVKRAARRLQEAHPFVKVVSANLQPLPAAILEGPEEIFLTAEHLIWENFGAFRLAFQPQSFSQVTHETARALYGHVGELVRASSVSSLLDLYCGVGGFSMAAAPHIKRGLGVELSEPAIECAKMAAGKNGFPQLEFISSDANAFLTATRARRPDGVVVNPPRRGLSASLIEAAKGLKPKHVFYSSCNPETLFRDLKLFAPEYRVLSLAPFDMFPLTEHLEAVAHLVS